MMHGNESPCDAARRLSASAIHDGYKPEALHVYTDKDGAAIHWRIRLKHPDTGDKWIRPMKFNGNSFVLGEPQYPDGKPLYRLHELSTISDGTVFIVEGEWCADHLVKVGILATTSGAADSASKTNWQPLAGRDVMIWPDNDDAGQRYAQSVADALVSLGCTVRIVDVQILGLPTKGDAVDWVQRHPNALVADIAALPATVWKRADKQNASESDKTNSFKSQTKFAFTPISALKIKPIDWLIQDHLECESFTEIFGPPESGKSLLAIDWGLSIASGLPWNGHTTKKGAVFYIAGEGHNGLMRRFTAWSIKTGIKLDALPLYVSTCSAAFYNGTSASEVEAAISERVATTGEIPRLIVIDTLARNFGGGNENSTEDMGQFIQHIDRHLREQFQCAVLVVHHTGHSTFDRGRGSSALKAAVDTEFSMKRDADLIRFTCTKMKDAPHPEEKAFVIEQINLGLANDDGWPMLSVILKATTYTEEPNHDTEKLGKNQRSALSALEKLLSEHRNNLAERGDDPDNAKVTVTDWEKKTGLDRNRFHEVKVALIKRGKVQLQDNGYFAMPVMSDSNSE